MKKKETPQLDLFPESAVPTVAARELGPLPEPDAELVALAARLSSRVLLGTSSWTFPGWSGLVYRREYPDDATFTRRSLEEYARFPLFRTVGIDRSYYAPIPRDELAEYAKQLPVGFRCVSKVWQEITTYAFPNHPRHGERAGMRNPRFLDAQLFVSEVFQPYREAFAEHAGPFVFEIPPSPVRASGEEMAALIDVFLTKAPRPAQYAFELRDAHLLTKRYFDVLAAHGAAHVYNVWSRMPSIAEQRKLAGENGAEFFVSRLLMPQGGDYEALKKRFAPFNRMILPQLETRRDAIELVREAIESDRDIYMIANNKLEGSSPLTLKAIIKLLLESGE